ncbi:MAG: hypothetical protein ACR2J6_05720 [Thermoleophilaceae bacterium]
MSTLAIVLIVAGVIVVLLLAGGVLGARKRDRHTAPAFHRHLEQADRALEVARAGDRGWDPAVLERAVQETLSRSHPGVAFESVHLVLVDDQPGVERDRAHYDAHGGERPVRVVLTRDDSGWHGETAG